MKWMKLAMYGYLLIILLFAIALIRCLVIPDNDLTPLSFAFWCGIFYGHLVACRLNIQTLNSLKETDEILGEIREYK